MLLVHWKKKNLLRKNPSGVNVQLLKRRKANPKMSDEEGIVFVKDTEKVFVTINQSGIPPRFFDGTIEYQKSMELNPVSFGTEDIKKQPIMYLDVDDVIEFYNLEYERLLDKEGVPVEVTDKLLSNFFLFRKVKKEVIIKETIGIEV